MSEIRTRQGVGSTIKARTLDHLSDFRTVAFAVSDFRTRHHSHGCEPRLEPQDVAGGQLALGHGVEPRHPPQQAHGLELAKVIVQRGAADLAVTVGIGKMIGGFSKGLTVYLCGETYCLERQVVSLQLNGVNHETVHLGEGTEVGFMFDGPGKKNSIMMVIEKSSGVNAMLDAQGLEAVHA